MIARPFHELSVDQLYEIMKLRQEVFVVEQDCAYLDADDCDQVGLHLMYHQNDILVAYARILPVGVSYESYASIGRIIVAQEYRGKGLGQKITEEAVRVCQETFDNPQIKISAQCYILDMYEQLGFSPVGETYLEDGIPHQAMIWKASTND